MNSKTNQKIIGRGAEAILIKREDSLIIKDRIKKGYRLKFLDEKLRKSRTKSETKLLNKASKIIYVPQVISSDNKEKIKMQFIQGKKLSEHLDALREEKAEKTCEQIGQSIAKLHKNNIIHGDLTTSNMILVENKNYNSDNPTKYKNISLKKQSKQSIKQYGKDFTINKFQSNSKKFKVYFIDFGLGFHSHRIEDKAVDLHLLKQALEAKHFKNWKSLFSAVLKGYKSDYPESKKVLQQLKKVESRGRYKKH